MSLTHWPSTLCVAVSPLTTFDNRVTSQGSSLAPKPNIPPQLSGARFLCLEAAAAAPNGGSFKRILAFPSTCIPSPGSLVTERQFNLVAVENASRSQSGI